MTVVLAACGGGGVSPTGAGGTTGSGGAAGRAGSGGGAAGRTGSGGKGGAAGQIGSGGRTGSGGFTGVGGAGGLSCSDASPCVSGVCTGTKQGCSGAWTCAQLPMGCTADLATYCACDGTTSFQESSTCPTRPYLFKGSCDLGVVCDMRQALCAPAPPTCPAGQVPSVVAGCWGACVPIQFCRCSLDDDCPSGRTCRMGAGLCSL